VKLFKVCDIFRPTSPLSRPHKASRTVRLYVRLFTKVCPIQMNLASFCRLKSLAIVNFVRVRQIEPTQLLLGTL